MLTLRPYEEKDLNQMMLVWNEIVQEGIAFPQEELLTVETAKTFFADQSYTGVADKDGQILGVYILHPNNVGRCGHISNASYAVSSQARGQGLGRQLVEDCLKQAKRLGFEVLQFNAVVESNTAARQLYEKLGFIQLGTIPRGFRLADGSYAPICPYYRDLADVMID